jgi:hypothetical protein
MSRRPILKVDGVRVPSVTTVLSKFKDPGGLMWWANQAGLEGKDLNEARDVVAGAGTLAHELIESDVYGDKEVHVSTARQMSMRKSEYAEAIAAARVALENWRAWKRSVKLQVRASEITMVHPKLRFGGTFDALLGTVEGDRLVLVDWKTSKSVYADFLWQVAAYTLLWAEGEINEDQGDRGTKDDVIELFGGKDPREIYGREIEEAHVVRISRDFAAFSHHSWSLSGFANEQESFRMFRDLYDRRKLTERKVG